MLVAGLLVCSVSNLCFLIFFAGMAFLQLDWAKQHHRQKDRKNFWQDIEAFVLFSIPCLISILGEFQIINEAARLLTK